MWPAAEKASRTSEWGAATNNSKGGRESKSDRQTLSSHLNLLPSETGRALPWGHSVTERPATVNASNLVDTNQMASTLCLGLGVSTAWRNCLTEVCSNNASWTYFLDGFNSPKILTSV